MNSVYSMKYLLFNGAWEEMLYIHFKNNVHLKKLTQSISLFLFTNGENCSSFAFHEDKRQVTSRKIWFLNKSK